MSNRGRCILFMAMIVVAFNVMQFHHHHSYSIVPAVCEMLSFDHCDGHDGEKDAENTCAYHQMLAIENANPFKIVEKEDGLHGLSLWRSEEPIIPYETKEWLCIKRPKCPLPQFGERVSGLRAPPVVG